GLVAPARGLASGPRRRRCRILFCLQDLVTTAPASAIPGLRLGSGQLPRFPTTDHRLVSEGVGSAYFPPQTFDALTQAGMPVLQAFKSRLAELDHSQRPLQLNRIIINARCISPATQRLQ